MIRVTILLYEHCQILDVTGPASVFEVAGHFGAPYVVTIASERGGKIATSGGIVLETVPVEGEAECDILLVPGSETPVRAIRENRALVESVARTAHAGRRVASICSGTFFLAEAGVLDGRRAATHWQAVAELRRRYPRVTVDPDSIFVEDLGIWSSAGVAAGIDLALAMVARDYGEPVARKVAQKLVVYYRRPGTQSQHSAMHEMVTPDNRFAALLAWAREHLNEPMPVERLADQAALSVRQFTRAFTEATGLPPAKAVERLRVEAARAAIEAGARSLEEVARSTGFGSGERMRRAFVKITGQPPAMVRRLERDVHADVTARGRAVLN
jgi:transcriptional regulator GlxA family with amidase domain